MKLLRVIATVDPASGGPIEGLKRASAVMAEHGVEVEIATLDAPGSRDADIAALPWPVHPLGPGRFGGYQYSPRLRDWLDRRVRDYDAVIVHGNWQYHGLAAARACLRRRVPYFVFPHGMLDPWFNRAYPLKKLKKQLYWNWGEHFVLSHATDVLFTCEEERVLARESFRPYRVREKVAGYGTRAPAPESYSRTGENPAARWGGRPYLLYLGRIQEKKGIDLLVEAYAHGLAGDPAAPELVIAGPEQQPDYAAAIRARVPSGRIHWIGPVDGEAKWPLLHGAEALALVSHQENFGLVVAEALAVGTPVLLSDKVNIWREVADGKAGLVETDSLDGARALLDRWQALAPEDKAAMRTAAQTVFAEHFDIEKATLRLIDHLRVRIEARSQAQ